MTWYDPWVECFRSQEEVVPELPALDDGDATPSAIRLESRKKKFTIKVTWHPSGWDGGEVDLFFSRLEMVFEPFIAVLDAIYQWFVG